MMDSRHDDAYQTYETVYTNAKAGMEDLSATEKEHIKRVSCYPWLLKDKQG